MHRQTAIALLSQEAFGHSHTADLDWYAACAMAVDALIDQEFRERKGDETNGKKDSNDLASLE